MRDPAEDVEDAEDGHETGEFDFLLRLVAGVVVAVVAPGGGRAAGRVALSDAQVVAAGRAVGEGTVVVQLDAPPGREGQPPALLVPQRQMLLAHGRRHRRRRQFGRVASQPPVSAPPVHLVKGLDHAQVARNNQHAHGQT